MPSPPRWVALVGAALAACSAASERPAAPPAPAASSPGAPASSAPAGSAPAGSAPASGAPASGAAVGVASAPAATSTAMPVVASAGAPAPGAPAPGASAPGASAPGVAPPRRLEARDFVGLWLTSEKSYDDARASVEVEQHRADGVYRWGKYDHKRKIFTPARVETRSPGFVMRWEIDAERGEFVVHNDGADEHTPAHLDGPGRFRTIWRDGSKERTVFHLKIE